MKVLKGLIPGFLRQLDQRLLVSQPWLWSTKVHYHLWMLLVIDLLLAILAFALPINLTNVIHLEQTFSYLILVQVTYLVFWIYRQVRFNVTKDFGHRFFLMPQGEFLVRWISILCITSISYVPVLVLNHTVANAVDDKEFTEDLNALAKGAPYFSGAGAYSYFRSLDEYLHRDSLYKDGKDLSLMRILNTYRSKVNTFRNQHNSAQISNKPPEEIRMYGDSLRRYESMVDSIETNFPMFFVSFHNESDTSGRLPLLSRKQLQDIYVESLHWSDEQHLDHIRAYMAAANKYGELYRATPEEILDYSRHIKGNRVGIDSYYEPYTFSGPYYYEGMNSHSIYVTSGDRGRNIRQVWRAKFLNNYYLEGMTLFVFGVIALMLANLLFIFRSMSWRWFLASFAVIVVTAILISVITLLVDALSMDEDLALNQVFAAFWITATIALMGLLKTHHSARATTCMAIVVMFMPILIWAHFGWFETQFDPYGINELQAQITMFEAENGYKGRGIDLEYDRQLDLMNRQLWDLKSYVEAVYWFLFVSGMIVHFVLFVPMADWMMRKLRSLPLVR